MTYQNSKSEFPDGLFVFKSFADMDEKNVPKRTKPQETTILIFTLSFCILIFNFLFLVKQALLFAL